MKRIIFILFLIPVCLQAQINNLQRPFSGFYRAVKLDNIAYIDSADVGGFFITKDSTGNTVDNLNVFPTKDPAIRWVRVVNSSVSIITGESTTYLFEDSTNNPPTVFPPDVDTTFWMVGGAPTGIFVDHDFDVAVYVDGVFDVFIDPNVNDWGLTLDDNFWHQFNGSTWPRRNPPDWTTSGNFNGGIMGSLVPQIVYLRYNNINRIILLPAGVRIPSVSSTTLSLVGANATGLLRDIAIDTLSLIIENDTLRAIGGGGSDLKAYKPYVIRNDSISKRYNVLWYGAKGDGVTDDCPALTATVAAAFADGGGNIILPAGHYILGCPLIHSQDGEDPNAQIVLPLNNGSTNNFPNINFQGEAPQNMSGEPFSALGKNTLGTVIESTILDTGWVFGSSSYDHIDYGGDVNWTWWTFKDLQIRTRTKTAGSEVVGKMGAINSNAPRSIKTDGIMISTQSASTVQLEPDSTIGIKLPHWNNNSRIELNRTTIQGYYTGLWAGEHLTAHDLTIVNTHNAIYCPWAIQSSYIDRLTAEAYANAIYVSDEFFTSAGTGLELYIGQMNVEHNNTPATWNTYASDVFYEDSSVLTKIKIGYYHAVETGTGRVAIFNTNAPTKVTYSMDGNEYFSGNVNVRNFLNATGIANVSSAPADGIGPLRVTNTGTTTGLANVAAFYGNRGTAGGPDDNTNIAIFQKNATNGNYANIVFAESNNQPVAYLGAKIITHSASVPVADFSLSLLNGGSRTDAIYIQADGDFGIGNTNPQYKLHVTGNIFGSTNVISPKLTAYENSTGYTELTHVNAGGATVPRAYFLGYGSSVANFAMYVASGNATGSTQIPSFLGISTNAVPTQAAAKQMLLYQSASISQITNVTAEGTGTFAQAMDLGLGGTFAGTPGINVKTTGIIQMQNYGAGTATFDASGNISSVSDERVKNILRRSHTGLRAIMNLRPIEFRYNGLSGNETKHTYIGFSAQNVKENIPHSTGLTPYGYLTLDDRSIIAASVIAIQELKAEIEELKAEIKRMKK